MAEHHTETYYIKPLDNLIYQSEPIIMELNPCAICNRTFVPETLEKHIKICEKWATKKRRIFDSSRQRREGTEMATYLPKDFGLPPSKQTDSTIIQSTPSEVRIESSQPSTLHSQSRSPENNQPVQQQQQNYHQPRQKLVMTNNGKQGCAIKKSLSPTSRMTISHIAEIKARAEAKRHLAPVTEQCPECGRHFGIKAYDRHVEFCKEKSKISQFKGNNTSQAKERLEARTKYRAPNLRLKRAAVRDKYSVNGEDGHDENRMDDFLSMSNSLSSSFMSDGGFSDKYDPFLSAKRQLEELCSPTATTTTKTNFAELKSPKTPLTPKNLTNSNTKKPLQESVSMSTSYTGPSTSSSINPTKTLNAVKSNFRRTSSLRAPRKITPSRPIFVPPSRTRPSTIQRGISDEGPISTNFIKPEEYDEMPVKSACINNFATSINSPRLKRDLSPRPRFLSDSSRESSPKTFKRDPSPLVVRRSSNSNLNRRNLRLNLSNGEDSLPSGVQKTDSLAVFLKYENELVRGLADASKTQECNNKQIATPEIMQRSNPTQPPVTEKDLKDKTNILSKQNSLKNSSNDLQVEKNFNFNFLNNEKDLKLSTLKSNSNLSDQQMNARNINYLESRPKTAEAYASINKILPIKLEPLPKSVVIKNSISNLSTPLKTSISSSASYNNTLAPLFPSIKPLNKNNLISHNVNNIINNSINITSIFSNSNTNYKDCSNYIDPKLINSCDNLKVTPAISIDDIKSNLSQDSCNSTKSALDKMNIKGNCVSKEDVNDNIDLSSFSSQMKRSKQDQQQDHSATCSRNSTISEKSNKLFKRQIRLGKNQFLYDASPTDSESSPDLIETDQISGNNNAIVNSNSDDRSTTLSSSSVIQTTPITQNLSQHNYEKEFESFLSPSINPIFDNFDFEEFLASFENNNENDDLFPGFKDCKEFLMNRCLNMRSNFNFNRNFHQYHNNTPCDSIRSQKTEAEQNFENKKRSQNEDEKHEIFISIETDQNENDDTLDVNSCPSDPSIMKNPEVEEINGNDNKFTKIETYHLPVFEEDKDNTLANFEIKTIPRDKFVKKIIQEENKNFENNNRDVVNYENLMVKAIESTNSDLYPVDSDEVSSVECYPVSRKSVKSKASSDSAYGSLSRNSPTSADQTSLHRASARGQNYLPSTSNTTSLGQIDDKTKILIKRSRELNTSSSGSENSLLPVVNNTYLQQQRQKENSSSKESSNNLNVKSDESDYNFTKDLSAKDLSNDSISNCNTKPMLSKFCYECGSKFLVATAKFCMECGVKRLAIE